MAAEFKTILELFDRDVQRHIEEVIKVDQRSPDVVREEIEEYVATESIKRHFVHVLERFQETPNKPHEGIGIWISGFFGAGKSLFAKILGYVLENRELDGTTASELFGLRAADPQIQALLKTINEQIPAHSVIFDVSTDESVTDASEQLTDIAYRVLLRELGYPQDHELAELEIELEAEDQLEEFKKAYTEEYDDTWDDRKDMPASARNRASAIRHKMDSDTYPSPDTWAKTPLNVTVTAKLVAQRAYELSRRRAEGRALVFVIDEVGQYVARSTHKMLDLMGLVHALGIEGKNRANDWKGQVWLVVTSQEKLNEVVDNLEGKTVELAKLIDRFPLQVDLAQADIREVTSERVLKKKPGGRQLLMGAFQENKGKLLESARLRDSGVAGELDESSFAELYPFLPYQIDLIIKIVLALRTQGGASRLTGGGARSIIKHAQQMLINERTQLGSQPVGRLVTLDLVYELLLNMLPSERKYEIAKIEESYGEEALGTKVAKALVLLEVVKEVPRTVENLAAVLHPSIDSDPIRDQVAQELTTLAKDKKVRETEDGWELLTKVAVDWETEKQGIDVTPRKRRDLLEELSSLVFEEIHGYRHKDLKTFTAAPIVNGQRLGRGGDVDLIVDLVVDSEDLESAKEQARKASNTPDGQKAVRWVIPIGDGLRTDLETILRSREMVGKYEPKKLSPEQSLLLNQEKTLVVKTRSRALEQLRRSGSDGYSYLRGIEKNLSSLGSALEEQVKGALRQAVPELYPKFDMAAAPAKSGDAAKVLSDSLAGLPPIFYGGQKGLGLLSSDGGGYKVNEANPALQEVMGFIEDRKKYGEEVSGRKLEQKFTGIGYGWDADVVMSLVAALFRGSLLEVYLGQRFTSYADEGAKQVFSRLQRFRTANFTPRGAGPTFEALAESAETIEALYGKKVSIEEGAIARAVREQMPQEVTAAHRVHNVLDVYGLPGVDQILQISDTLEGVTKGSAEDVVVSFHEQREVIKEGVGRLRSLSKALTDDHLKAIRSAQSASEQLWPELRALGETELEDDADALAAQLADPEFSKHLSDIGTRAARIEQKFSQVRADDANLLLAAAEAALGVLRNRPEWNVLEAFDQQALEKPFREIRERAQAPGTSISGLRSDLVSVDSRVEKAIRDLVALHEAKTKEDIEDPEAAVEVIKVGKFKTSVLRTEDDVEQIITALREACLTAIEKGKTVILE
ncbi:BREX system P-loop protein BrxC [Gemmatimonadota bacterium]